MSHTTWIPLVPLTTNPADLGRIEETVTSAPILLNRSTTVRASISSKLGAKGTSIFLFASYSAIKKDKFYLIVFVANI